MNRLVHLLSLFLLLACVKEVPGVQPSSGDTVTIRVTIPEDSYTKVAFTPEEDHLGVSWQEGDKIRVISGENSQVYTLSKLISAHEAEFSGPAMTGTSFDILCPGTYAGIEEAEADTATPTQSGNGSTEHLRYRALLSGVDQYTDIAFTASWASAHGGSLRQGAALKIVAQLPEGVTTLKSVGIGLGGKDYSLPLANVDVSASARKVTAYLMLPWEDIALPDGSSVPLYVTDTEGEVYSRTLTVTGNESILQGRMNTFGDGSAVVGLALQDYVSGNGTAASPYLIANARQLNNMHGTMTGGSTLCFRLLEDIDASGIGNWTPLNATGTFDKGMDFDGAGHTIGGLTSSGVAYASFAGVLYGSIHDVTFSGARIQATSKTGVVAGFLGTTSNDYARVATCTNVTVRDSEVTSTAAAGGFAGHVRGKGAVTGCKVVNTTVSGTSHLGGFAAIADITGVDKYEVPAIFSRCEVEGVTLNQNCASASTSLYTGGFIGESYQAHSFIGCQVKGTVISATQVAISNVGGFVGYTGYAGANFKDCTVDKACTITTLGTNAGGFVGYATTADAYLSCSSAATVNVGASAVGSFAGYACGAAAFTGCSATGNVSGQRFVGGFAGVAENASFTDCGYSGGTVTGNTTNTNGREGGFVGSAISGITFQGCYVSGAKVVASGAGRVGGFVGNLGNSSAGGNNIVTTQCRVADTQVSGATNTGGFVGVQYEDITVSYVSGGSVTAGGANCGGFSGYVNNGRLTNCYTTASVSGGSYSPVGGMIGIAYAATVSYCYASGTVTGSGSDTGAFIGQCSRDGTQPVTDISNCIGWSASLPFCASNEVEAVITNGYAGAEGTVSLRSQSQTWPSAVWDMSGSAPVLLSVPRRIPAIFVGDSITWQWARNENTFASSNLKIPFNSAYMTQSGSNVTVRFHPGFFSGNGYVDKGISGQNTAQMLSRFQKDVIDLNPRVVVIMGGTNDLAQGVTKEQILANISAMAEMADEAGIRVVLCSVTPCNETYSKLSNPKTKGAHIITLNGMLQSYAGTKGFSWCDYWTSLVAEDGLALKEEYRLYDNLHPGPDGYDIMEPIIQSLINGLIN